MPPFQTDALNENIFTLTCLQAKHNYIASIHYFWSVTTDTNPSINHKYKLNKLPYFLSQKLYSSSWHLGASIRYPPLEILISIISMCAKDSVRDSFNFIVTNRSLHRLSNDGLAYTTANGEPYSFVQWWFLHKRLLYLRRVLSVAIQKHCSDME